MGLRKKRSRVLEFKELYKAYLALKKTGNLSVQQQEQCKNYRSEINRSIPEITSLILNIGESTTVYYHPPPVVGGLAGNVDLLANIFNLPYGMDSKSIFDMLDRGIGRYDYQIQNQWKQWVNPLHWLGEVIRIPFYIIKFSGFDSSKIELSIPGKMYKAIASFTALVVGFIKIYQFLKDDFPFDTIKQILTFYFN